VLGYSMQGALLATFSTSGGTLVGVLTAG